VSAFKTRVAVSASLISAYKARVRVTASLISAFKAGGRVVAILISAYRTLFYALYKTLEAHNIIATLSTSDLRIPSLVSADVVATFPTYDIATSLSTHDLLSVLEVSNG
jgi:hypothetical protein